MRSITFPDHGRLSHSSGFRSKALVLSNSNILSITGRVAPTIHFQVRLAVAQHDRPVHGTRADGRPGAGPHVWSFADFGAARGVTRTVGLNLKSVFTPDRRPRLAARFLREQ